MKNRQRLALEPLESRNMPTSLAEFAMWGPLAFNIQAMPIVEHRHFVPAPSSPILLPTLVGPATHLPGGGFEYTHPTFRWQSVSGAFEYQVRLFEGSHLLAATTTPSQHFETMIPSGATVKIEVWAIGIGGMSAPSVAMFHAPGRVLP